MKSGHVWLLTLATSKPLKFSRTFHKLYRSSEYIFTAAHKVHKTNSTEPTLVHKYLFNAKKEKINKLHEARGKIYYGFQNVKKGGKKISQQENLDSLSLSSVVVCRSLFFLVGSTRERHKPVQALTTLNPYSFNSRIWGYSCSHGCTVIIP